MSKKITVIVIVAVVILAFFAACGVKTFNVTLKDGFGNENTHKINSGSTYSLPSQSKEGYEFLGWSKQGEEQKIFGAGEQIVVNQDSVFVAQWKKVESVTEYTVCLSDGDKTLNSYKVNEGQSFTLPGCSVEKEGHKFAGWLIGEKTFKEGDSVQVRGDIHAQAVWEKTVCEILFMDGESKVAGYKVDYGNSIVLPEAENTVAGRNFLGWEFEGRLYKAGDTVVPEKDMTFNAKWEDILYTVSFVADGEVVGTQKLPLGQIPQAPEVTDKILDEKTVLVFEGWTPEIKPVSGDAVYSAVFKQKVRTYTVSFDGKGLVSFVDENGSVLDNLEKEYGQVCKFKINAEKGINTQNMFVMYNGEDIFAGDDGYYTVDFCENAKIVAEGMYAEQYNVDFVGANVSYLADIPEKVYYNTKITIKAAGNEWFTDVAPVVTAGEEKVVPYADEVTDGKKYYIYELTVTEDVVVKIDGVADTVPVTFVDINGKRYDVQWNIMQGFVGLYDMDLGFSLSGSEFVNGNTYMIASGYDEEKGVVFAVTKNAGANIIPKADVNEAVQKTAAEELYPSKTSDNVFYIVYYRV